MDTEKSLSQEIIANVRQRQPDVNVRRMASAMGITTTQLWRRMSEDRKWTADLFLEAMATLGALTVKQGRVILHCDLPDDLRKKLLALSASDIVREHKVTGLRI